MRILKKARLYRLCLAISACFSGVSTTVPAVPLDQSGSTCPSLFSDDNSVLGSAFHVVSPEPYLKMCLESAGEMDTHHLCQVAAAYVHEARRHEVHLRMPGQCVRD